MRERRKERETFYSFLKCGVDPNLRCDQKFKIMPYCHADLEGGVIGDSCRQRRKWQKNDSKVIDAAQRIGGGAAAASLR